MKSGPEERPVLSPVKRAYLALEEARAKLAAIEASRTEPIAVVGWGAGSGGADDPGASGDSSDGVTRSASARRPVDIDQLYDPISKPGR
jgi:hypothetical protein